MSRRVVVTAVGGAIGLVLVALLLLRSDPVPVRVVPVETGRVERTVSNTKAGTIKARRRAKMSPEVGGRVVEVPYREGDRVEAGAVILRLNDASQRAQMALAREAHKAARASYREACIVRDRARRELERKRKLAEQDILGADALDRFESQYEGAVASCNALSARVAEAEAQIDLATAELAKYELHAPFDGVIAELDVQVGEWVTPSPPLLIAPAVVDLIDPESLYVSAPMDEVDSAAIRTGQAVRVTIDSYPGQEFAGQVVRVAPYVLDVEAQNRTVEIEVELDDAELSAQLLPGTSADVEVILDVHEQALRVPAPALLEGDRVLVVEDDTLVERSVEVGLRNWDWAEITRGLGPGERVVVSLERAEVRAGARVEVVETRGSP
jgi:HlyD family secretion protein